MVRRAGCNCCYFIVIVACENVCMVCFLEILLLRISSTSAKFVERELLGFARILMVLGVFTAVGKFE
jgi:hypothetical protein